MVIELGDVCLTDKAVDLRYQSWVYFSSQQRSVTHSMDYCTEYKPMFQKSHHMLKLIKLASRLCMMREWA
jgi:hypothetical protein